MDIHSAGEQIKQDVSIEQILSVYGYKLKNRKMLCPFHADRNMSLSVFKNNSWYCFGCLKGGSVIDFVMEQEGCNYQTAVRAIDNHFRLGLLLPDNPLEYDRTAAFKRLLNRLTDNLNEQADLIMQMLELDLAELTPQWAELCSKNKQDLTADEWTRMLWLKEQMEYIEYKLSKCDEIREEVRLWQRQKILDLGKAAQAYSRRFRKPLSQQ